MFKRLFVLLLLTTVPALAQTGAQTPPRSLEAGRIEFDLSGWDWHVEGVYPGRGMQEGFHTFPPGHVGSPFLWTPAKAPGDVYTDLWRAGQIEDPYFGRNLEKLRWVMDKEWWYTKQFNLPKEMRGKTIRLQFDGVDYSCEVWFNNTRLGAHEGMFSGFSFDVTKLADFEHQNRVMIRLAPPPLNLSQFQGKKFFWGGDYYRFASPIGIWRPVRMIATDFARITDAHVESVIASDGGAEAQIEVELDNTAGRVRNCAIGVNIQGKNFSSQPVTAQSSHVLRPGFNRLQLKLRVPDAQLWWPWDQGEPNLYRAEISISDEGKVADRYDVTFGIRSVRMEMNPGFTKDEVEYPWTMMINGRRHYLRSAAWGGPPSILYGRTPLEHYRHLIREARAANINNLRIFGWHPPEIKEFYDLCDEAGITVWQVFPFGNAVLPKDNDFIQGALREAEAIVKERRNHPSVVLWQGGEEIIHTPEHLTGSNLSLTFSIGEAIKPLTSAPYFPLSSMSHATGRAAGFKPKENIHAGERFYSLMPQTIEDYYRKLDYAIVPELMISSAPNVESIKKFIPQNELWPPGPSWGYHWADLDVFAVNNLEVFGDTRMNSLEEFVAATQIAQGTEFQYALEHFRRRKPKTSGTGICHFITYWPDFKWGLVDYYGERKRSFEMVARAYQPLLVTLEYTKRRWLPNEQMQGAIWVVNDLYDEFKGATAQLRIQDKAGKVIEDKKFPFTVTPDSAAKVTDVAWKLPANLSGEFQLHLSLTDSSGKELSKNQYTFLVGDEEAARKERLKLREHYQELKKKAGSNNYYRFFPELTGEKQKRNY